MILCKKIEMLIHLLFYKKILIYELNLYVAIDINIHKLKISQFKKVTGVSSL